MPASPAPSRHRSGAPRRAAVLAVVVAVLALAGPAVSAPPQERDAELRVAAGWDGLARSGELLPVRITLAGGSDGAVADVEVKSINGGITVTEVPLANGGDTARGTALVLAPSDGGRFDVRVTARRRGDTVTTETVAVEPVTDEQLVGVLPALAEAAPPPEAAPLSVPVGSARYVDVDPDIIGLDGALAPIGTLAATNTELAGFDDDQRTALLSWLSQGGRLLVDGSGGPVPGLPEEWQPASVAPDDRRVAAGLGEVLLTGGRLAQGDWTVEPTPTVSPNDPDVVAPAFGGGPVGSSIAREAGLRIPSIGTILGFLVGYVVLAGPVTFLVLSRLGRAELAWLLVPLLAVGFAIGGFLAGGEARDGSRTAFATSVLETPGADVGLAFVGVLSRDGGDRTVSFPRSWWAGNISNDLYGTPEANVRSDRSDGTTTGTVSLVGGEFAVLSGRGPSPPTAQLQLDAAADGAGVSGTVRNTTDRPLRAVAVFVGNRAVLVGDLAPGQQDPFQVSAEEPLPAEQLYVPVEAQVWPAAAGTTSGGESGPVDLALWGETTRMFGADLRAPGSAVAVGWTDAVLPGPDLGAEAEGRSAIVARAPVEPGIPLNGLDVRRDLLRGPNTTAISDAQGPSEGAVFRFVLPPRDIEPARLQLSVPPTLSRADVWDGTRWNTVLGESGATGPGPPGSVPAVESFDGAPQLVGVGDGAVVDGVVYVRAAVSFGGPPNSAADLLLREAP